MPGTTLKPKIFPVLLVNFIGMLGYSIIIPMLVFLVQDFGGNAFVYGVLGAVYPALQFVGAPLLGQLSDQVGRKRVLLISQVGTFLAWGLFIIALLLPVTPLTKISNNFTGTFLVSLPLLFLFLARAFDGLTGGNVSVANAYLADISTAKNRKANFGKMASSTSLGFILGPTIAGLLGASLLGNLLPVIIAAFISLFAIVIIWVYLPESKPELLNNHLDVLTVKKLLHIEPRECYKIECENLNFWSVLRMKHIPFLFIVYFLTFLGFSFFYAGFPLFASGTLNWTPLELGVFFTVSSLIMVVIQGPFLSYLDGKVTDAILVIIGSVLLGVSFLILPMGSLFFVYLGNVFLSVGNGLMWPSFLSILSGMGSAKNQGTIQGYAHSMGSLASIIGLLLGGFLFGTFGSVVFILAGALFILIFSISFHLLRIAK